jgi:hypothetical protein
VARSGPLLTEAQWKKIAPLLPKPPRRRNGGRPWIENRRVLEGIPDAAIKSLSGNSSSTPANNSTQIAADAQNRNNAAPATVSSQLIRGCTKLPPCSKQRIDSAW